MGGAKGGEIASRLAASALGIRRRRQRRAARRLARPGGEPAGLRAFDRGRERLGHGHDDHPGPGRGRDGDVRARRRLPRLPDPRPQHRAADRRPFAGRGARAERQALARRGRDPPAALGDHARARDGSRCRRRHVHRGAPGRRPLLHLLGRPDVHGRERRDPRRRRAAAGRPRCGRARARGDGEPERRRGQHHRRLLRDRPTRGADVPEETAQMPAVEENGAVDDEDTLSGLEGIPAVDTMVVPSTEAAGGRRAAAETEPLAVSCSSCSWSCSSLLAVRRRRSTGRCTCDPQKPRAPQPLRRRDHHEPRLRQRVHRAPGGRLHGLAVVRAVLLRALRRGARRREGHGAPGRPVPAAPGRPAHGLRRDRDLPPQSRTTRSGRGSGSSSAWPPSRRR